MKTVLILFLGLIEVPYCSALPAGEARPPAVHCPGRTPLAVEFLIDKSGSTKEEAVLHRTVAAVREVMPALRDEDEIGVIAFDIAPFEVVRLGPGKEAKEQVNRRLNYLVPASKTELYGALQKAIHRLRSSSKQFKHIVILSDGTSAAQDSENRYHDLLDCARTSGITLSAVQLTRALDSVLLKNFAQKGYGMFYRSGELGEGEAAKDLAKDLCRAVHYPRLSANKSSERCKEIFPETASLFTRVCTLPFAMTITEQPNALDPPDEIDARFAPEHVDDYKYSRVAKIIKSDILVEKTEAELQLSHRERLFSATPVGSVTVSSLCNPECLFREDGSLVRGEGVDRSFFGITLPASRMKVGEFVRTKRTNTFSFSIDEKKKNISVEWLDELTLEGIYDIHGRQLARFYVKGIPARAWSADNSDPLSSFCGNFEGVLYYDLRRRIIFSSLWGTRAEMTYSGQTMSIGFMSSVDLL